MPRGNWDLSWRLPPMPLSPGTVVSQSQGQVAEEDLVNEVDSIGAAAAVVAVGPRIGRWTVRNSNAFRTKPHEVAILAQTGRAMMMAEF